LSYLGGYDLPALKRRVGDLAQLARVERVVEDDGPGRGARRLRIVDTAGLDVDVHVDRCLDLGAAHYRGVPLAWRSPAGHVAPGLVSPGTDGWLRSFAGGLVTTCGLDTFGAPSEDGGETFPLHGRVSAIPAAEVSSWARVVDDGYELGVAGIVRQSSLFGANLLLRRSISTLMGSGRLLLEDTVTNDGYAPAPHMVLYHCNLGWPLVDEGAEIVVPGAQTSARDEVAARGLASWSSPGPPQAGFREQVFRHDLPTSGTASGTATAAVRNPRLGLELEIEVSADTLPHCYQWTMTGTGTYVLALEPANCAGIDGRRAAAEAGILESLGPGESRRYRLAITVRPIG
jgi:hypothetical protein